MKHSLSALIIFLILAPLSSLGQTSKGISKNNPGTSSAGPRTALVIGNARYTTAPLRNPVNDARAISSTLKELGFQVTLLEDARQKKMKRAIDKFGRTIRDGGVGLFYFSGHGMQVDGRNYLIPVDAEVDAEADVEYEAVEAGRVLAKMKTANNGMNLVILDACRNNPFARSFRSASKGLATLNAPSGTFIAYATSPGSVASDGKGDNGLYTGELIKHMKTPGLKVEEVFKRVRANVQKKSKNKQVPWDASSLTGDFFFNEGKISFSVTSQTEFINEEPSSEEFSLTDLDRIANEEESLRKKWLQKQKKMNEAVQQLLIYEKRNISPNLKFTAWKRFLIVFSKDNPFSFEDDQHRTMALNQKAKWKDQNDFEEAEKVRIANEKLKAKKNLVALKKKQESQENTTIKPSSVDFFTVGSTKDEVIAVQGSPEDFSENKWWYGSSSVRFRNGRVVSWDSSGFTKLKAKLIPKRIISNKDFFTVGSTKDEVIAVQGSPEDFSENKWWYGSSSVRFRNGRVVSWDSSGFTKLKAKLKY